MTAKVETGAVSGQLLNVLIQPPARGRAITGVVLAGMVATIGLWDSFTGTAFSLSVLYLVPVSLTALWYGSRSASVVVLVCAGIRAGGDMIAHGALPPSDVWNVGGMLIIHLFVIWLIQSLLLLHRRLEQKIEVQSHALRQSEADRYRLEMEVLDISARERSAFGRELHDEVGQHFVATALAAQALAEKLGDTREGREALAIVAWIQDGIAKMRRLARGLLLSRIEPKRLAQELEELAIGSTRGRVQCRVRQEGREIEVDASRCAQLFRIAQEAVANALRHGRPGSIQITLGNHEEGLHLTVEDDGSGFRVDQPSAGGLGLRIMQYRAAIIGAVLEVRSAPGEGTRILCRLPHGTLSP